LDLVRRDLLPSPDNETISKKKRKEICRDLVAVVESLSNANELGYASSGKLSPTKQTTKAHKKVKRAEKIAMHEEGRRKKSLCLQDAFATN